MKSQILIALLFLTGASFGQTGYFGAKNIISLNYIGAPSFATTSNISSYVNEDVYHIRGGHKFQSPSYRIEYDRILNDKFSIGLGYTFSSVRVRTSSYSYINDFGGFENKEIDNIKLFNHSINLNFKVARGGGVNPVGKYWGAEVVLGRAGYRQNKLIDNFNPPGMNSLLINGFIGRTFAITNSLFFSLEGRLNVLGFTSNGRYIGFNLYALAEDYAFDILDLGIPFTGAQEIYSEDNGQDRINTRHLSRAIFEYNYIAFKVGVHYAL